MQFIPTNAHFPQMYPTNNQTKWLNHSHQQQPRSPKSIHPKKLHIHYHQHYYSSCTTYGYAQKNSSVWYNNCVCNYFDLYIFFFGKNECGIKIKNKKSCRNRTWKQAISAREWKKKEEEWECMKFQGVGSEVFWGLHC